MPPRSIRWKSRAFDAAILVAPVIVSGFFLWLLADLLFQGSVYFWPSDSSAIQLSAIVDMLQHIVMFLTAEPEKAGREGGVGPILVSTGLILAVCMSVALPLGLGTAMLLSEFVSEASRFGRAVRRSLDILAGVPSIVFGLFGNAFFCQWLGLQFSILAGGLTLACMVLPLLVRAAEEGFRAVPQSQRHTAAALGFSRSSLVLRIILPQAAPGILAGLILGIGRALAETAALIFTSGYVDRMPQSLLDSGRAISVHIYDLSMNVPGGNSPAYASALVLVVLLVVLNFAAWWLVSRFLPRRSLS